ncbi:MAG: L,D-transpeptidase family protein, partial [Hyphomicrobium sp.]
MQRVVPQSGRFGRSGWTFAIACVSAAAVLTVFWPADAAFARRSSLIRPLTEVPRPDSPLLLHVSIKKQRVRVFDANGEVTSSRISSGQPGFDTPTGVFSILEKNEYHESNIYEGAPMPHMQRLTWSGIALHAGVVPGYRASHGCIRLPASFAQSLFGLTKVGARVVVSPDDVEPVRFDHPNLFKPLPAETPRSAGLQIAQETTQVAANDASPNADTSGLNEIPQLIGISPALAEA